MKGLGLVKDNCRRPMSRPGAHPSVRPHTEETSTPRNRPEPLTYGFFLSLSPARYVFSSLSLFPFTVETERLAPAQPPSAADFTPHSAPLSPSLARPIFALVLLVQRAPPEPNPRSDRQPEVQGPHLLPRPRPARPRPLHPELSPSHRCDMKPKVAAAAGGGEKGRGVDPLLPRFKCQECHRALVVVGVESFPDKQPPHANSGMHASSVQGSIMGASRMDSSYVVLSKQNKSQVPGIPPRPPSAAARHVEPNQSTRAIEGSYIMLPPAAASIYKTSASEGGGAHLPPPSLNSTSHSPGNNSGFHSSVTVLKRAFEIASSQTQVEQPLCLECMRVLSDKMDKEIEDVNTDIKAYDVCLQRLEQESYNILSETDFNKEKQKIEEEEKKLKASIEEAEKQYSEVSSEMKDLETKSKQFEELEERYWHEFNSFQFQLTSHQEERDAVLAKIEVSQVHLELLKRTNVLNDAFYISHDGVIGTINNFRLGRLPSVQVEWDEINAAWGQAALLLHTMAQYFPKFQYRIKIHPMGSYPRVTDINNNTYELFGPVNLFWSTRFDKAMTWFLTCLQEFAEFAISLDKENNVPSDKSLKLPYKIDGDKVGSYTIFLSFNKLENWTKALKYMLCNLKWVLYWFIGNTSFAAESTSLHLAQSPNKKG